MCVCFHLKTAVSEVTKLCTRLEQVYERRCSVAVQNGIFWVQLNCFAVDRRCLGTANRSVLTTSSVNINIPFKYISVRNGVK